MHTISWIEHSLIAGTRKSQWKVEWESSLQPHPTCHAFLLCQPAGFLVPGELSKQPGEKMHLPKRQLNLKGLQFLSVSTVIVVFSISFLFRPC